MRIIKEWLRPKELEEEYGIPIETQDVMRKEKAIPFSKLGTIIIYNRTKINKWIESPIFDMADSMENEKDI
jgi:hypothetical protein